MKKVNIVFSKEFGDDFWEKSTTSQSLDSLPWKLLKQHISKTCEISSNSKEKNADITIGFNTLPEIKNSISYIILLECASITPKAYAEKTLAKSDHIFSWSKEQLKKTNSTMLFFPQNIPPEIEFNNSQRSKFSCIISANKSIRNKKLNSLYNERIKTIRWFEKNQPNNFDLYGRGWSMPAASHSKMSNASKKLVGIIGSFLGVVFFPSYLGEIKEKSQILNQYKFCFCYENASIYDGYITEKIFDCFLAGCIPIYWGAPDIQDYIPPNCYIDRRNYKNHQQLFEYLSSLTDTQLKEYQRNIYNFLKSEKTIPFTAEYFAKTIANQILIDIGKEIE